MELIDARAAQTISKFRGRDAKAWLESLPSKYQRMQKTYGFEAQAALPGGITDAVISGVWNGHPAVLKIAFSAWQLTQEMRTMQSWGEELSPAIWVWDQDISATIMERISPGIELRESTQADEDFELALEMLLRSHHCQAPRDLQTLTSRMDYRRERMHYHLQVWEDFPKNLLKTVEMAWDSLVTEGDSLCHGDPHGSNIISCQKRGYALIDAAGLLGNPVSDITYLAIDRPQGPIIERLLRTSQLTGYAFEELLAFAICYRAVSAAAAYYLGEKDRAIDLQADLHLLVDCSS